MSKHTPGPWIARGSELLGWRVLSTDGKGTIVCQISGSFANPQVSADAHMVAVAPELVDALSKALAVAYVYLSFMEEHGHPTDEGLERLDACAAVLAKARGEP